METIQFGCHVGGPFGREKLLFEHFYTLHEPSRKSTTVFVDIPYVIGCGDVCES